MKIPTAEEFCKDLQFEYEETGEYKMYFAIDIHNALKVFAKLHVKAALEAASDNMMFGYKSNRGTVYYDAYPETNIK